MVRTGKPVKFNIYIFLIIFFIGNMSFGFNYDNS